jgi:hypothetical protein
LSKSGTFGHPAVRIRVKYVPRCEAMRNKSRIDFFLVSEGLINIVNECNINETLQSKLFDHKAVKLKINQKVIPKKRGLFISNRVLSSDILELVVHSCVAETYLHHLIPPPPLV